MTSPVLYDLSDSVATIKLNRPDALNACNEELLSSLTAALHKSAEDPSVRAIIITGAGRAFCAGLDLESVRAHYERRDPPDLGALLRSQFHPVIEAVVACPKLVIAAINGVTVGAGLGIALSCDYRVASDDATFFSAFQRIAAVPDTGVGYFLPGLVGRAKAIEFLLFTERADAKDALRLGLVNQVVSGDLLADSALELARRAASGPTFAIDGTKQLVSRATMQEIKSFLDLEATLQTQAAQDSDHLRGMTALLGRLPTPDYRPRE